jgi:hypothetical protein
LLALKVLMSPINPTPKIFGAAKQRYPSLTGAKAGGVTGLGKAGGVTGLGKAGGVTWLGWAGQSWRRDGAGLGWPKLAA